MPSRFPGQIDADAELRLLEERHAEELFAFDHFVDHVVYGILASEWSGVPPYNVTRR